MTGDDFGDVILHWDQLDWVEFADAPGLRLCPFTVDQEHTATMVATDYAPGFTLHEHFHTTDHIELVLSGELTVSGRVERAGDIRLVPRGVAYGPLVAGPEGARVIEIFPVRTLEAIGGKYTDPEVAKVKNNPARNSEIAAKMRLEA